MTHVPFRRPPNPDRDAVAITRPPRGARATLEARVGERWVVIAYACGADGDPEAKQAIKRFLEESVVAAPADKRAVPIGRERS